MKILHYVSLENSNKSEYIACSIPGFFKLSFPSTPGTPSPQHPSTGSLYPHEPNPQGIPTHHLPAQEQVHTPESSEQLEELIPFPQPTYYRDFRKKFRYKLGN